MRGANSIGYLIGGLLLLSPSLLATAGYGQSKVEPTQAPREDAPLPGSRVQAGKPVPAFCSDPSVTNPYLRAECPKGGSLAASGQKKGEQTEIDAVFCKFDVASKTIRILPWDAKAKTWKRDSVQTLVWDDQTRLISGGSMVTMPEFVGGKPLDQDTKNTASIQGQRGQFYVETIEGKDVLQNVELMLAFAGESFAAMVGNNSVQFLGNMRGPNKISCGR